MLKLSEDQVAQKASDLELLVVRLDIDQSLEINRGIDLNIFKKPIP